MILVPNWDQLNAELIAVDALIAGTARTHRLILVTGNSSEFLRVPGLSVEDWREFQVHEVDA